MKPETSLILLILLFMLFPGKIFSRDQQPSGKGNVIFEEIGQFNDGGMAVKVLVRGNLAYVCEFDNGLEILDVSHPAHIRKLMQIDDTEQSRGVELIKNIAYVSCNVNGLKFFDIGNPLKPVYLGHYRDRDGDPHQFLAGGHLGYLTEWHGGFDIIDISDPLKPIRLSQYKNDMLSFSADIVDTNAFVTGYTAGLKILDISNPKNPVLLGEFNNGGETNALQVRNGKAYVCDKVQGLEIMDVSDLKHPRLLGTYNGGGSTVGVQVVDNLAFIINWERGLEAVDVSDPGRPVMINSFYDGGRPNGLQVIGDLIYLADGPDGLEIIRIKNDNDSASRQRLKDFPLLKGPYLGQKPPGGTPEPFAASIFDPRYASYHTNINFSPDGQEAYWSQDNTRRRENPSDPIIKGICVSKVENDHWTKPKLASFSPPNISDAPFISPDGKKLYFITTRPIEEQGNSGGETIWVVDRTSEGWSEPKPLPPTINSMERIHWSFSVDNRGNIYFGARSGIYCSKYEKGEYQRSEELDVTINKPGVGNSCPFISPDGSYLIFTRWENKTSRLLISFRNQDGSWPSPKEINSVIEMNEEHGQICPYVSPDGQYFFFLDTVGDGINTRLDIRPYWVDAAFIQELRQKE